MAVLLGARSDAFERTPACTARAGTCRDGGHGDACPPRVYPPTVPPTGLGIRPGSSALLEPSMTPYGRHGSSGAPESHGGPGRHGRGRLVGRAPRDVAVRAPRPAHRRRPAPHPGARCAPGPPRAARRRRRGRGDADHLGARDRRQPVGVHAAAARAPASRLRPGRDGQLLVDQRRRTPPRRPAGRARRAGLRGDRVRARARRRALARRSRGALLRPAARRRRPRPHARDARQPALGHSAGVRAAAPAGAPAAPGQRRRGRAGRACAGMPAPASSRCGATSTR